VRQDLFGSKVGESRRRPWRASRGPVILDRLDGAMLAAASLNRALTIEDTTGDLH
jgi:hypothetical protein